jgi:hypothetical protein
MPFRMKDLLTLVQSFALLGEGKAGVQCQIELISPAAACSEWVIRGLGYLVRTVTPT